MQNGSTSDPARKFIEALRDFQRLIDGLQPEELGPADRVALRLLLDELLELMRLSGWLILFR